MKKTKFFEPESGSWSLSNSLLKHFSRNLGLKPYELRQRHKLEAHYYEKNLFSNWIPFIANGCPFFNLQ